MALSKKQQAFVEHYLRTWNASESARLAGYSEKSAGVIGYENLRKPQIKEFIDARMAEIAMSANEVLMRLTEQARGSIGNFLAIDGKGRPSLDFNRETAKNNLHLIKKLKITPTEFGPAIDVELYDAQAAAVHLGKYHKLFTDKTDLTSDGQPIAINIGSVPNRPAPPSNQEGDDDGRD